MTTTTEGAVTLTKQHGHEIQAFGTVSRMPIALAEATRRENADNLNQLLADTITLRDLYKKHHWQVSGPTFHQLHLLFSPERRRLVGDVESRHHGRQMRGVAGGRQRRQLITAGAMAAWVVSRLDQVPGNHKCARLPTNGPHPPGCLRVANGRTSPNVRLRTLCRPARAKSPIEMMRIKLTPLERTPS